MDSRHNSFYIDVLRGNINLEDQRFSVSENSPMLVQDSPLNDEVVTSTKKTTYGINFSPEEDKLLVAAWLNTSVDPVYGNEQYRTTFYGKVTKYFKDHKTDSTRSISSLTSRCGVINRSLAKIEAKNESGTIAKMKLLLKDFSKWAYIMPREDSRKEMPQTPDSIVQKGRVDDIMDFERPIGRKAENAN
ncbi:hypothetical protein CFP56_028817 [Quercus suber]|uniref:Uncharacterized protein n=1 Tax=Quercus suber TaxID=58331 RepID=A0AAW0JSE0_QUESU